MNTVFVLQTDDLTYSPQVFRYLPDAIDRAYMIIEDEYGLTQWQETTHVKGEDGFDHFEWNFWFTEGGFDRFITIAACEVITYEDD